MGALFASQRFGIGQQIDVSALEALVGNVDARTLVYTMTGERPQGRTDPVVSVASGVLPCQDGFMFVQAGGARFTALLQAIGEPEMAADTRFATQQGRQEHRDELDAKVMPWMMDRTRREVFAQLQAHGVQCAPVQKVDETITDPQTVARGFFAEIDHPETGSVLYPGAPFIVDGSPWEVRTPAPRLGQHNEDVFCGELGLSTEELSGLRSEGIVR
jgi:crotonobetainyl-CoA:carnitine CoA-transferase CaiB-like acyl-CoA transferase